MSTPHVAGIAAAVRDVARGRGDEEQSRLVALRPLDAWGDVWHALTRLQDETERFALDTPILVAALKIFKDDIGSRSHKLAAGIRSRCAHHR